MVQVVMLEPHKCNREQNQKQVKTIQLTDDLKRTLPVKKKHWLRWQRYWYSQKSFNHLWRSPRQTNTPPSTEGNYNYFTLIILLLKLIEGQDVFKVASFIHNSSNCSGWNF